MKCPLKNPSTEVATSSRFLQNAACLPYQTWNKQMLPVLLSVLCAACGSSGTPSDSETVSELQNSQAITEVSTYDSIFGPGYREPDPGQSGSEAPAIAAAQSAVGATTTLPVLLASAETELGAPGQSVSSALQELGSVVSEQQSTPVESAPVPAAALSVEETSEAEEPVLSPETEAELVALESDLAELAAEPDEEDPQIEVLPVHEPDSDDDGGSGPVSGTFSYESIEANGLGNGTYPSHDYYLAEFLYQNPDVCFWEQDKENKTITAVETPAPPENSIYMPSPSGGDDTSMLENFFRKNAGKSVNGDNRTYKVKTLDIDNRIDIFNMALEPASGAKQMIRIKAPDVRIFNSPMDGKNQKTLAVGYNVEDGAHRFVLVNSDVKNFHHKQGANAAAVFIRGANDFQIVCNRFESIFNATNDKSQTARANSIWMAGRHKHNLSGGLIANNYANDHQSNGKLVDAEFFTIQGYKSVSVENPVRIFANRAYNAGKRFTKNQEGSTLILSNYIEWNTKKGPLGTRRLIAPFVIHQSNNVTIRNNRVSISAEGKFDAVFKTDASTGSHTAHLGGSTQKNIHFDNNDVEIKDNRNPSAKSGPILMKAVASHVGKNSTGHEAENSSANNNNVHGSGSLRNYFVFLNGYSDNGGRFEHKNNVFSIPFYKSEYR